MTQRHKFLLPTPAGMMPQFATPTQWGWDNSPSCVRMSGGTL